MLEKLFSKYFQLNDLIIAIHSNSLTWLDNSSDYLTLGPVSPLTANLELTLLELSPETADLVIPLPSQNHKTANYQLLLDSPISVTLYQDTNQIWSELEGIGRTWKDYDSKKGIGIRYKGVDLNRVYINLLYASGLITKLLVKEKYYKIHASGAVVDGKGIVFIGNSGKGKSTTALALLENGHSVLSDETVLLYQKDHVYSAHSITDVIKTQKATIHRFFPKLENQPAYQEVGDELYYKIGLMSDFRYQRQANIHSVMILNQTGEKESSIEKISPSKVVSDFLPATLEPFEPSAVVTNKFSFLMQFLNAMDCYCVHFGTDMKFFVTTIEKWAGEVSKK